VSYQTLVQESLSNAIERLAFTEIAPTDAPVPQVMEGPVLWARIRVRAPLTGTLALIMPAALVDEFTASIWVESPPDLEAARRDFIAEICNTVVGLVVSAVVDLDSTFILGLPDTGSDLPDMSAGRILWYVTDGGSGMAVQLIDQWPEPDSAG
jgi:hypothetical protein